MSIVIEAHAVTYRIIEKTALLITPYYDSTSLSGRKEFGSYTVVNLRAEAPVYSGQGYELLASVDLNNLTDEQYEMPWQFQDPGFNAFANLEVRF